MFRYLLLFSGLLLTTFAWAQETAYVTDILRLGIHRAQDTSDRAFDNLISGTELTVLERVPNYARVRTPDGAEGWVRSAFIVSEKPAQARVAELEAELEALRRETAEAEASRLEAEENIRQMTEELSGKIEAADAVQDTLARLRQENADYESLLSQYRGSVPVVWVVGALIVAFAGGALAGTWWVDRSIRRRFGGHRIF